MTDLSAGGFVKELAHYLPFVSAMVGPSSRKAKLPPALIARIVELAFVGGMMYAAYKHDMGTIHTALTDLRTEVAALRPLHADIRELTTIAENNAKGVHANQESIERMRSALFVPRGGQ
ncbi:MAG: hypothetical protein AB7Q81_24325 [Gammaproteobacteria bacterium]